MRIRITVEHDNDGGREEWSIARNVDAKAAAELDDTIVGKLITPMMIAFDAAAVDHNIPDDEWEEE